MKEIFEKQIGPYAQAAVEIVGGKARAGLELDLAKLLDDAAVKVKAAIPGTVEEPFVDAIVAQLKTAIGIEPVKAPA